MAGATVKSQNRRYQPLIPSPHLPGTEIQVGLCVSNFLARSVIRESARSHMVREQTKLQEVIIVRRGDYVFRVFSTLKAK